MANLFLTY